MIQLVCGNAPGADTFLLHVALAATKSGCTDGVLPPQIVTIQGAHGPMPTQGTNTLLTPATASRIEKGACGSVLAKLLSSGHKDRALRDTRIGTIPNILVVAEDLTGIMDATTEDVGHHPHAHSLQSLTRLATQRSNIALLAFVCKTEQLSVAFIKHTVVVFDTSRPQLCLVTVRNGQAIKHVWHSTCEPDKLGPTVDALQHLVSPTTAGTHVVRVGLCGTKALAPDAPGVVHMRGVFEKWMVSSRELKHE